MARNELWATGFDESVEVNQRALINKILARYSGEFTVFRELLQNSDDAGSNAVEIHFETEAVTGSSGDIHKENVGSDSELNLPDLKTTNVFRWTFKNNGRNFREEDWNRLKKIAEGNPDEDKIGAFGVGFYSVFSVTDTPFVSSGSQWMGFYWRDNKDQLFARRGNLPPDASSPWTTFELALREASPMPPAFDLTRFLSSSIVFMNQLSEVSIYFDDKRLTKLTKSSGVPRELGLPKGLQTLSPKKLMKVKGVGLVDVQIVAEVLGWVYSTWTEKPRLAAGTTTVGTKTGGFFSPLFSALSKRTATELPSPSTPEPSDPLLGTTTSLTVSIFSADVEVQLDKKLGKALYRSTLKDPPSRLRYELIYTSKDEYDKAVKEDEKYLSKTMNVFHGLRADLEGFGLSRIYIGHATAQTTGIAGHMAARFIPTVERESIDLMDPNVATWNRELLFIGGFLARAAYEHEINNINEVWRTLDEGQQEQRDVEIWLGQRGLHALKFFTFHKSAPLDEVSASFENSFFSCGPQQFSIVSTQGVRNAYSVRYPDSAMSGFIKNAPVLTSDVIQNAHRMVSTLRSKGIIKETSFEDVILELRARPLGEEEMLNCLQWWINLSKSHITTEASILPLLGDLVDAAVLACGGNDAKLIQLSSIKTFVNPASLCAQIPSDGPLPNHLFPLSISRKLAPGDMSKYLLWTELTILDWVKYTCDPLVLASESSFNIEASPSWAERVLHILARTWSSLSATAKEEITILLARRTCIPTSQGMKSPANAYFESADIFHDLPVVTLQSGSVKGSMVRLLEAIGVHKHVDLQMVFNRMVKTKEWTTADLIGYLVSIKSTLTSEEMTRLKATPAFLKEESEPLPATEKLRRFQAKQLYEPTDALRQIGLPVIDWAKQKKWRSSSKEANFLFELGLRRHPPLDELISLCARSDSETRQSAFKYLLDNVEKVYKESAVANYNHIAFIPARSTSMSCLGAPKDVFIESEWAYMGFLILDDAYRSDALRLGISLRPPVQRLISFLEHNRPRDKLEARVWFELFASRVSELKPADRARLSQVPMVPHVKEDNRSTQAWLSPEQCYLSGGNEAEHLSNLFIFVDYGVTANSFLIVCGAKRLPSLDEIAQKLLEDPSQFHDAVGGHENFLAELRQIGLNFHQLSNSTLDRLRRTACLLGAQRICTKQPREGDLGEFEDSNWEVTSYFKMPNEIVIVDDTPSFRIFGESLFTAPQEDVLEGFYHKLGAHRLSELVKEDYNHGPEHDAAPQTSNIRSLILERLPLFLHERSASHLKVSMHWLGLEKNFEIKTFRGLNIRKSLSLGNLKLAQTQDASAVAYRSKNGAICLWTSSNVELDMYEVATGLSRLILEKPTANDALLLTTILSTDLGLLRKRGFDVERILKKRAAERNARVEPSTKPNIPNRETTFNPLDRNLGPLAESQDTRRMNHTLPYPRPLVERHKMPSPAPLARSNITTLGNTIENAIRACHSESDSKFDVLASVRESLEKEFHDTCGAVDTLRLIDEQAGVKIYLAQDLPQLLNVKQPVLGRFLSIITTIGGLFELPMTSLHVFFDTSSQHIAFNREGSLFFNLRFYEAWHDSDVIAGNRIDTFVFWYFTFAHEIAHNLVQDHNAEHEFYFSATSQKYIVKLFKLF